MTCAPGSGWLRALACAWALAACGDRGEPERRAFVQQFVDSVQNDTEFYRRNVEPGQEKLVEEARANMAARFEIVGWDRVGLGATQFEYYVRFGNGASGVVYVTERSGQRRAAIVVGAPTSRAPGQGPGPPE